MNRPVRHYLAAAGILLIAAGAAPQAVERNWRDVDSGWADMTLDQDKG